jgi:RNA polymerase sigma-70 factor (ECF subfamily)
MRCADPAIAEDMKSAAIRDRPFEGCPARRTGASPPSMGRSAGGRVVETPMFTARTEAPGRGSPDAKTFIGLLAAHGGSLYRFIYTLMPDPDQAQDVYQECVMTLWEKFGEFRPDEPFLPWAYRFAHFKVLAQRKKDRRRPAQLADEVLSILAEVQIEEDERFQAQLRALPKCLDRLTQNERRLLQLRYEGGASLSTIAEETERHADTLYRTLHRVRKKLLHCIERRVATEEPR